MLLVEHLMIIIQYINFIKCSKNPLKNILIYYIIMFYIEIGDFLYNKIILRKKFYIIKFGALYYIIKLLLYIIDATKKLFFFYII